VVLSLLLVALVGYTGCDLWGGRRVAKELAALESRYGSFTDAALSAPGVPAPENRARLIAAAAALVNPGTNQERSAISKFISDPAPKTVPPALRTYMESNADAIRLARQFVSRTRSSFGVDYRSSGDRPPWFDMRVLSHALYLATLQSIEARRPDEAAEFITAGLSLSSGGRNEPDLIAQLIRIAAADPPLDALQRLFEESDPTKAGLEQIARALAENREPLPLTIGLLGEVKHAHYAFAILESGRSSDITVSSLPLPFVGPAARLFRPILRWAQARYLDEAGRLLDLQTGPRPRATWPDTSTPPPWALIDRMSRAFTDGLARLVETGDDFAGQLAAAELVVALRRYKLDHAAYPEDLAALAPGYLPGIPIDPATGSAPVYARDGNGFTLRTVRSARYTPTKRPTPVWRLTK